MGDEIRKGILKKFMYCETLNYNQIWDKKICSSSLFDYHLKKVIDDGYIVKKEGHYELSDSGFRYLSRLDGISVSENKMPIVCAFGLAQKENGDLLIHERKKQPFFGYHGISGGKVEHGLSCLDTAKKEFFEETGLDGDFDLRVVAQKMTFNDETSEVIHHIIAYYYICRNFKGELLKESREGINRWMPFEEFLKKKKRFLAHEVTIPKILENDGVSIIFVKEYMRDGVSIRYEVVE